MKLYYYLFYRVLCLWKKLGNYDVEFKAMIVFCFILLMSVITLLSYWNLFTKINFIKHKFDYVIAVLSYILVNYWLLIYKDKYKDKIKQFENESKKHMLIGNILTSIVLVCAIIWFFSKIVF